jgi:3-hydroxybutyryl-CoA dehydratase
MTSRFPQIGQSVKFAKTIGESDIYLFAGITGDLSPNHVNEEFMRKTKYGRRIAHGALLIGFMSTASTLMVEKSQAEIPDATPVSLGYDRIRFIHPVFINSTVCVTYTIKAVDPERRRTVAAIEVHDQDGTLVAVAEHVLKWVANTAGAAEAP